MTRLLGFELHDVIAVALVSALATFAVAYFMILKDFDANIRLGTSANLALYSGVGTGGLVKYLVRPEWAKGSLFGGSN